MEPTEIHYQDQFIGDDDVSLMLRVQQGDTRAFALLIARYRTRLQRFFVVLLPDPTLADDFAQETLLRLWLSRDQYRPTGSFRAYLFQIGRHYYLNHRVRQQERRVREHPPSPEADLLILAPSRTQPEFVVIAQYETDKRHRAVATLPQHYRDVFILCHLEGLKYTEIADRLNIPVGTVKSRMAEAVRRLRVTLEETYE